MKDSALEFGAAKRQTKSESITENWMKSFHPTPRTLMGPGPSDVHPRVTAALARPTIGHLDPEFVGMMDEIKGALRRAFRTENEMTFPVSAPGSSGMELCFVNLVEPGEKVVICQNGAFGGRMKENVERCGGVPIMVESPWGERIDPEGAEQALIDHPDATLFAFVHAETSTGVKADAERLSARARAHGCLVIMDTVTGLGGIPVEIDKWEIDAAYSGTQKCLSCPPGLSPVTLSDRAVEKITSRARKVQSWFLDVSLLTTYWSGNGQRTYHHTAPVNALYGLHEALVLLEEEGLEKAWARHAKMHEVFKAGIEAMGLELLVSEEDRLPQLNAVQIPAGVDELEVRKTLLNRFNLEIGAGLGSLAGQVWRIGLMGHSATYENIVLCLTALEQALIEQQANINHGQALAAAHAVFCR